MIEAIHLGADIIASALSTSAPSDSGNVLRQIGVGPVFLMVGTIEPRKGYLQTVSAFERLWHDGLQVNLVIVGNEGWTHLPNGQRRTIPEIVHRLRKHPELGRRMFWLEGISDEILLNLYARADALLMASAGEGFGLPLIEAAQHGLPIIARNLPVFREIAGDNACYFNGTDPESLADSLKEWLLLRAEDRAPQSKGMSWLSWEQNAKQLLKILLSNGNSYRKRNLDE
jgi:glycosyltransferase involved in cell wall biosynthesis